MLKKSFLLVVILHCAQLNFAQTKSDINIIAYYSAGPEGVSKIQAEKITHIIFSFCHLKGNRLTVDSPRDSVTIKNLVELKKRNPNLKVILSLGGWGGCETCSPVFSSSAGRNEFSESVLQLNQYFKTDGIDLDWEYPTIEGHPGHPYSSNDKQNFTELINSLRKTLGKNYEISFAAGGFQTFLEESVDWKAIINTVDRINLMTYDLVSGFSTQTGHHTPLYSSPGQKESTDNCVSYLIKLGIPASKLVIGAAFYGRMWENVPNVNNGLYQSGKFKSFIDFGKFAEFTKDKGFNSYWDETAKAPYLYNAQDRLFVTYDNVQSMKLKTSYAIAHQLDGIMFWELSIDAPKDGLLDAIYSVKEKGK